jgi:hypothetical protein
MNLISLCQSDHSKTNFNREEWKIYFVNIIISLYNQNVRKEAGFSGGQHQPTNQILPFILTNNKEVLK